MSITLVPQSGSTLVSTSRLTQNAQLSALNTANPTIVASLLAAATAAIQRYTNRDLISSTYTEYDSGGNYPNQVLHLRQYPVTAVSRVGTNPQDVLQVSNGSTANQRATVATTAGGLTLYRMASGTGTSATLLYSTYPTITLLAAAINALGSGWAATVQGSYGSHPSADLRTLQGAYTALNGGAYLQMYTEELNSLAITRYGWGDDDWGGGGTYGWRLEESAGILTGRFPRGTGNIRVDYTAGYSVVPEDLGEACVQLVLDLYNAAQRDLTQSSGNVAGAGFKAIDEAMSYKVKMLLAPYRDTSKLYRV